jgi:hypothetical protein
METKLQNLIQKERRKQIFYAIMAAVVLALLILALSGGLSWINDNSEPNQNGGITPNEGGDDYVITLNNFIDVQFINDNIASFNIDGNITSAINPNLISSRVTPIQTSTSWKVEATVLDPDTVDPWDSKIEEFNFTGAEMAQIHGSFLTSLQDTEEINQTALPDQPGSAQNLLHYQVLFTDGSGLEFVWLGFDQVDVIQIANITWSEGPYGFNIGYAGEEHYISPLSAFDAFISTLQELYGLYLN